MLRLSQGITMQYFTQKLWTIHQNSPDALTLPRSLETDHLNSGISFKTVWSSMGEWLRFFCMFAYKEHYPLKQSPSWLNPSAPIPWSKAWQLHFPCTFCRSQRKTKRVLIFMSSYHFKFRWTEELKSTLELTQKFSCQVCRDSSCLL